MLLDEHLLQIGFTENECKVYLELLKIGPQPVSTLAKRLNFNRTTTYAVLQSLEKKGLASFYKKQNGVKAYLSNDPNCLVGYLDAKCRTYDYYRSLILSLIPKLRRIAEEFNLKRPVVSYFEGIEGVKRVTYDALKSSKEMYCYLSLHRWFELGLKDFILKYKEYRIKQKKVMLRAIAPDTKDVRDFFQQNYDADDPLTQILYVKDPEFLGMFTNEMTIYDDKVSIIHLEAGDEYGVVIQSERIADMQRKIFEKAWEGFENDL